MNNFSVTLILTIVSTINLILNQFKKIQTVNVWLDDIAAIKKENTNERKYTNLQSSWISGGRHGSDSAVGSSATLSGDQTLSSPPSWASSPPASPDSAVTAVSYIPDQQAVLQRVSFTTSSEVRQVNRSTGQQDTSRGTAVPYTPSITSIGGAVLR